MQRHFGEEPDETVAFEDEVVDNTPVDFVGSVRQNGGQVPPIDTMPINEYFDIDEEEFIYDPRNSYH